MEGKWYLCGGIATALFFGADSIFSEVAEAAIPLGEPIDLQLPTIPPTESISLTTRGIDSQLGLIQKAQDAVQSYHDKLAYLVEPKDPYLAKLKNAIAFYDAQHDKLLAMRQDIVQYEYSSKQPEYSDYHKNSRASLIRDNLASIVDPRESRDVVTSLRTIDAFVNTAQPGTILYIDTEGKFGPKGARFWYPLEGGVNPHDPSGPKLPRLISFKYDGASELPLSTSRALYELQLTLKDRMTLVTPLGEVEDIKSKPLVTAGAADTYKKHVPSGGHADLSGIDFRAVDTTPAGVAEVLADGSRVRNGNLWFEIPGSKGNPADLARLEDFRENAVRELSKHGYSEDEARRFIKAHTRLVPGANAMHYHFDTEPRPPILAPKNPMAQS